MQTPIKITIFFNDDETKTLETRDAMIGVWDGETNDDDVFYWFDDDGSELIGEHSDFTVVSVEMDTVKASVGDIVRTRSHIDLWNSFKRNEHRDIVFETVDLPIQMLRNLKDFNEFRVEEVDEDGDYRFSGFFGIFPKECVQSIKGGVG